MDWRGADKFKRSPQQLDMSTAVIVRQFKRIDLKNVFTPGSIDCRRKVDTVRRCAISFTADAYAIETHTRPPNIVLHIKKHTLAFSISRQSKTLDNATDHIAWRPSATEIHFDTLR